MSENVDSKDVVPYVLANYDRATDFGIADAEHQLLLAEPFSPDAGLLYALRISVCLPTLKKLNTLASRYNTACLGAGNMGLLTSKRSQHYQKVYEFLADRFLRKFTELADEYIQNAQCDESKCTSKKAKLNCWYVAKEIIQKSREAFEHKLPGLDGVIEAFETEIQNEIERINSSY